MKNVTSFFKASLRGIGLLSLLILLGCSDGFGQITRNQILVNARPYIFYSFTAGSTNVKSGVNCSSVGNIITPSWVTVGKHVAMPYCWGGFSTLASFTAGLAKSLSAGDDDCTTSGDCCESCALGVDCSGFVSRAWGLTTKYSTTTLENISTAYSSPTLVLPGDIFDYAGSHTRLVDTNYTNGNYKVMESSAHGWDVSYNTYTTAQLTSYSPRFYVKVQNSTITAAFTSNVTSGCSGMTVNYTDLSTTSGSITARSWSFSGGNPLTSALANPSVTYLTSGVYNVKEVVTSTMGKDSITNMNYINVVSASPLSLPLAETFQSSVFPPAGWSLNKQTPQDSVWELCASTGSGSSQCMYFPANCGNSVNISGERQQLFTPNYSFTGASNPKMWFDVAYEPSTLPTYSDTLVVYYSADCGNTWTSIYSKGGATLCTTNSTTKAGTDVNSSGCFVPPNSAAWRTDSVNIAMLSGKPAVMFSFESRSGWGNIIYMDNINIQHTITTSVQSSGVNASLKVYPNPFRQSFTVDYSLTKDEPVAIYLTDVLGRRVLVHATDTEVSGQHSVVIDWGSMNTAKGLYILQLQTGSGNTFMKLISE